MNDKESCPLLDCEFNDERKCMRPEERCCPYTCTHTCQKCLDAL